MFQDKYLNLNKDHYTLNAPIFCRSCKK